MIVIGLTSTTKRWNISNLNTLKLLYKHNKDNYIKQNLYTITMDFQASRLLRRLNRLLHWRVVNMVHELKGYYTGSVDR